MTRSQSAHERENDGIGEQELYKRLFCDPNLVDTFKNILMCVEIVLCIPYNVQWYLRTWVFSNSKNYI